MIFRMTSDVEFVAENLDDAFLKLSNHFKTLIDSESSDHEVISIYTGGSIKITALEAEESTAHSYNSAMLK